MTESWPVTWPTEVDTTSTEVMLAENYAAMTLRMLTLYRVGGTPITVMPCGSGCNYPRYSLARPVMLYSFEYMGCLCRSGCGCPPVRGVTLGAPVGRVDEVQVDGQVISPSAYRVENGNILVRTDGKDWPSCAGDGFTVTYLNAYPVDQIGERVAGLLAAEYLKAITNDKKCRLPSNITNMSRQGVSFEMTTALFPEGTTGITEVDTYLMQYNPHGLRSRPTVYSPDRPAQRQVTWSAP